jgi:hypothetical protein
MSSAPDPDQCAIGADKQLLSADKITFVFDPDDPTPLAPASEDEIMARMFDFLTPQFFFTYPLVSRGSKIHPPRRRQQDGSISSRGEAR